MEIKTAEDILFEFDAECCYNADCSGSSTHWETEEVIKAMQAYANQFVDLAAKQIWEQSHTSEKHYNKSVILDIKQLIK